MAAITDPAAVAFANTKIRPTADLMSQLYWTCKALVTQWNALAMSSKLVNTVDLVTDGSAQDGRNQITGAMCNNIVNRASEFIMDYEATSNAKLTTVTQVKVNGASKF